ncbi:hypothetical protein [Niallia sp.]|uniref:hypothetical protein n=1 Tax=Niallia sp. TaxID=2837523 RepID=UPI0028963439|nr:hypothetical protein [Niallia sp.]
MKKILFFSLFTFSLIASGCSNESPGSQTGSTTKEANATGQANTEANQTTASNKETPSTADQIKELRSMLKMKENKLPTKFPVTDSQYVTAKINENETDEYFISFYQTKEYVPINDESLHSNDNLIATFNAETYDDAAKQKELFPVVSLDSIPEDMKVDLGHQITGMREGAAGSSYLVWKEGRWVLQIKSISADELDTVDIAKKMVDYLEENALPVPKKNGRIEVSYPQNAEEVKVTARWEEGNTVYTLETAEVPINALMMTVSTE